jgi:hypothetical protein
MSTEWIKADDGELYPFAFDEDNFEKNLIGNYRAEEDLLPQIKIKADSDCKLAEQEVCFPIISEDERYRNVPNKIILALKDFFSEEMGLMWGIFAVGASAFIPFIGKEYVELNDVTLLNMGIRAVAGLTAYILFLVLLNKLCGLKAYGLSKQTDIWTINFKDETVVRATPISVSKANKNFKEARFCCNINESEYYLNGDDIYFSEEAAMNVLDFVVKSNDRELKRYYPNWKNDSNFVSFYKSNIYVYGFNRNINLCGNKSSAVIADCIEVNGIEYTPKTSIKDLFTEYLSAVNKQKKLAEENQKLIDKINDYQSSIK